MTPILETGAAATAAQLLTSLFKFAAPGAPSWALVVAALIAGIGAAFLVSLAGGEVQTSQVAAVNVLQGIIAAAAAAGIDRAGQAAQAKRAATRGSL